MKKMKRYSSLWVHQAHEAFRKAVAEAIAEHRRNGIPIAIWRNGKVVRIPADQIEVREPQVEYSVSHKKRK
jgi:hypothetical protein